MAGTKIRGITVEIGGDTSGLNKALSDVNSNIRSTQSQLRDVERLLKLDPSNTELLSQKQKLLKDAINETNEKLKALKDAQAKMDSGEVEKNQKAYDALAREIVSCENSLKELEKEAANSNVTLTQAAQAFENAGSKLDSIGKKASVASAAVTAVGYASIKSAKELDNGYDTIIKKTGATGEQLKDLQSVADSIYGSMATDMDKVGVAVGEVNTRFGKTGDELEKLSKSFLKFAEINGTDLNSSIDDVDSIMTKFNIDASKTEKVLGLLTKAGQDTGISMETLQSSLKTNGASFQELGLGLTESVNLLAQMESAGVDTSVGIAALKKSVTNLTSAGEPLDKALQDIILNIKNAKTDTDALTIASQTFGTKGAAEMAKAIRSNRLDITKLSGSIEEYSDVVNSTYEETLDTWDEAKVSTNNLKLASAELGTELMTTLAPIIQSVTEGVKGFTEWFKNLDDGTKSLIATILLIVATLGPLLIFIGKVSTGIAAVIKILPALKTGIAAVNAVMAANPIGAVIVAITALVAALIYLYNNCEEFREEFDIIMNAIFATFKDIWDSIVNFFTKTIPDAFDSAVDAVIDFKNDVVNWFINIKNAVFDKVNDVKNTIIDGFSNAVKFITDLPGKAFKWGKDMIDGFIDGIKSLAGDVADAVEGIADTITGWLHFSRPDVGPLRDYEKWMPDMIDGMVKGINNNAYKVRDAVASMAEQMELTASPVLNADVSGNTSINNVTKVYLGNKELTDTMAGGVIKKITNQQNDRIVSQGGPAIV